MSILFTMPSKLKRLFLTEFQYERADKDLVGTDLLADSLDLDNFKRFDYNYGQGCEMAGNCATFATFLS